MNDNNGIKIITMPNHLFYFKEENGTYRVKSSEFLVNLNDDKKNILHI